MPDGQQEPELGLVGVCPHPRVAGARTKPDCDFAMALLQELTIDPSSTVIYVDTRIEPLPEEEAATILRALAREMRAGCSQRKAGVRGRFDTAIDRLGGAITRCVRGVTLIVAPICSTLLNTDALAIARRLRADPTFRRKSRR